MGVHRANENFTCPSINGCAVVGQDGASFTISGGGSGGGIEGGSIIPGITWAAWSDADGGIVTGTGSIGDPQSDAGDFFINTQLSATADRNVLNINEDEAGQILYSRAPGTSTWFPVVSIRTDTGGNGNLRRIRGNAIPPNTNNQDGLDFIDSRTNPGDEVLLADVGDDGLAKDFLAPFIAGSDTTASTFSLHGAQTAYIQQNDTISSTTPYSTSNVIL